jgi:Core-2/I-Branching enzyme
VRLGAASFSALRLAYIISAYHRLGQVARLVRRLNTNGASFFVHVDKKTDDDAYAGLESSLEDLPVLFLDRHTCHWGGFGHVRATLKGIDKLRERGDVFDYAILLTGQDYPIKPNEYIERFFETQRPKSFMGFSALPSESWSPRGGLGRIEHRHIRLYGRHLRSPFKRRFPPGLLPYGGGAYWCLSRDCIEYVARFVERRPDVVSFFRHVDIPDEIFFHTILLSSELRDTIVNDNLRYIDWTQGSRPAILRARDFEALQASPKLYARKFDMNQDERVLDLIDRHLLQPGGGAALAPTS